MKKADVFIDEWGCPLDPGTKLSQDEVERYGVPMNLEAVSEPDPDEEDDLNTEDGDNDDARQDVEDDAFPSVNLDGDSDRGTEDPDDNDEFPSLGRVSQKPISWTDFLEEQ